VLCYLKYLSIHNYCFIRFVYFIQLYIFASFVLILLHCSLYVIIPNPNDANSFWTCDFVNAYFNNDDEMHYGDNEFDKKYSDLDEEQFNGSYDWDDPFFNRKAEMHGFCNDLGHGYFNPDHDTLHCRDDTYYDWSDTDSNSNCDSEEEFDYVNGLVGEMASYVQ